MLNQQHQSTECTFDKRCFCILYAYFICICPNARIAAVVSSSLAITSYDSIMGLWSVNEVTYP